MTTCPVIFMAAAVRGQDKTTVVLALARLLASSAQATAALFFASF